MVRSLLKRGNITLQCITVHLSKLKSRRKSYRQAKARFQRNTLEVRRNQARAVMMYRIVYGLIAIPASLYLTPNTQNTRGHGCKFRVPAGCVDAFNYSFFPTTIWIWNQLPAAVVMSPSIEAFKSRLMGIPLRLRRQ